MRLVFVVMLFLSFSATAQEPVSAELVSDPFLESYQPEVSVSGNIIVGVMTAAAASAMLHNEIVIRAAADKESTQLCLKVSSRDGIYTSKNVYALPDGATGPVLLPYRSKLADVVEAYGADEIAMVASTGDCDSGSSDYFLLSAVNEPGREDVVIYLNSFGATDVFVDVESGIEECEYISEGRRTTYDFICRFKGAAKGEAMAATIIRERFGREQPAVELTIIGAAR